VLALAFRFVSQIFLDLEILGGLAQQALRGRSTVGSGKFDGRCISAHR
jgi:hypothetical protein